MPLPPRTRTVPKEKYGNYVRKSDEFERAARDAAARGDWDAAVANAVHSGVAMMDALMVFHEERRSAAQDHEESLALIMTLNLDKQQLKNASSHLTQLLRVKAAAEYEERLLGRRDAEAALKHLLRLKGWGRSKLP